MKTKNILAVLAGGLTAFIWSSISWMAIPWHQPTMRVFENETSVGQVIKAAAPEPGIYTYPGWTEDEADMQKKHEEGPFVFASVVPGGVGSGMGVMMVCGFLIDLAGATVLLILMSLARGTNWTARARTGLLAALFVSLIPALLEWNWWHFALDFTVVAILDNVIAWTLAALVIAKIGAGKGIGDASDATPG